MKTRWRLVALTLLTMACSSESSVANPEPEAPTPSLPGPPAVGTFAVTGDPTSQQGATWVYRETLAGVAYDLSGVLKKPVGNGPFPAVIVSHGFGGNARGYSSNVGAEMVQWGLVVIAANYTHASGATLGSPGLETERGASVPNVQRATRMLSLLQSLGYVDMSRVAAHGHSMGAFVTAALVGANPSAFRAASHTAGGVRIAGPQAEAAAPVDSQVITITTPYQMHHGDNDTVVPLSMDQQLASLFSARGRVHELHVYPGGTHNDVPFSRQMYDRVRAWYRTHGVLP
ncbi:MAG: dienelactone hydrolase family protein [Gemmatimonadaceae bacterium]|nr:dienelactone hydrolase family protein [Gemmatimonadaceae bacterium]